jgi:hypothetical protein
MQDNFEALHAHEEKLRAVNLALIKKRADLTDHYDLVREAMNVVWAFHARAQARKRR